MNDYPFLRQIRSPITSEQLRPLDPRCRVVQFDSPLEDEDFRKLSQFMKRYPSVPLRIYGHGSSPDLCFLKWFPFIRSFQADVFTLDNWDGLAFLPPSLEFLGLGQTKRRLSLKPIAKFVNLHHLFLDGHQKDIDVIEGFRDLRYLTLRSITLPGLSLLRSLAGLQSLSLQLGGTRDLSVLPELTNVRYLGLRMIRGLADIEVIGELESLRFLFLQDLKKVITLPSFRKLVALRRCHIENLGGLLDITPISEAPNLEELLVLNMKRLDVQHFLPFKGHRSLKAATIGLGSIRRNAAVSSLLELPQVENVKPIKVFVEG